MDASSYDTQGGFKTPEDEKQFLEFEAQIGNHESSPIVDIFKQVHKKLRGVTIVFGKN